MKSLNLIMTESDNGAAPRQLTLFAVESFATAPPLPPTDSYWDEIIDCYRDHRPPLVLERDTQNPVPEQKTPGLGDYTDVPEHIKAVPEQLHWVEKYCPSNRKEHLYYRYCWKTGPKIKHRHISGGNVRSSLAQHRKSEVEIAIASGLSPVEIEKLIHSWRELGVMS